MNFKVLVGPVAPPRYVTTWEQSCAEFGISSEEAARYIR